MDININQSINIHKYTATRLKYYRNKRDLTYGQLSKLSGVDRTYLNRVEKCDLLPNLSKLPKICSALGCCLRDVEVKNNG